MQRERVMCEDTADEVGRISETAAERDRRFYGKRVSTTMFNILLRLFNIHALQ